MKARSQFFPIGILATQGTFLVWLYVTSKQPGSPEGTTGAAVEIAIPAVVSFALALTGVWGLQTSAEGPRSAIVMLWAVTGLLFLLSGLLAMALLGELAFGGIG